MRRYNIVSGILLILSIIGFALASPVLVQEKRQARVDVVHKDVITVSEKRGGTEDMEKLAEEFSNKWGKPIGSSDAHSSTSSPSPVPDRGSTNVGQAPAPYQAPLRPSRPSRKWRWTNVKKPLPPIPELPEEPSPVSSPDREPSSPKSSTGPASGYGSMDWNAPQGVPSAESPKELEADHGHQVVHPPTESHHEMVDAPPPSPF